MRIPPAGSRQFVRVLAAAAAALVVAPAAQADAYAPPSAAEIQRQIDAAWQKLEPVIEQYNKVRSELTANQQRSAELSKKMEPLGKTVEVSQARVQEIAARYYKLGNSLSTLNALLSSGSPTTFVDQLALVNQVTMSERRQITALSAERATYDAAKKKVDALIAVEQRQQADLAARKTAIDAEIKRLDALHKQVAAEEAAAAAKAAADAAAPEPRPPRRQPPPRAAPRPSSRAVRCSSVGNAPPCPSRAMAASPRRRPAARSASRTSGRLTVPTRSTVPG